MDSSLRSRVAAPTAKRLFVFGGVGLLLVAVVLLAYFGTEISANERKAPKGPAAIPVSIAPVLQEVVPFRLWRSATSRPMRTCRARRAADGKSSESGFRKGGEFRELPCFSKLIPPPTRRHW